MDKRRYETDDKFWEIWVDDGQVYTHFGALESKGQTKLKASKDPDADVVEMIGKKVKEGYKQTAGPKLFEAPALDAKLLKKHIAAITDDPATALPLADWLQGQQHPWGELIALQVGAASKKSLEKEAAKLLEQKGEAIFPALAEPGTAATWKNGFVDRGQIGSDGNAKALLAAAKTFLSAPAAARITTVVFAAAPRTFPVWRSWESSTEHIVDPYADLDKLAALVPKGVTQIGFGPWPASAAAAYAYFPTFTKISKAFPDVTSLELVGSAPEKLGKLSLPKLTSLVIRFANADDAALTAVAQAKLPKLERLEIGTGGYVNATVDEVHYPAEWSEDQESRYPETFSSDDLEAMDADGDSAESACSVTTVIAAKWPASLTHLGFQSSDLSLGDVQALLDSALLKQLKTVDLSNAQLGEAMGEAIVKAKAKIAHLETLELSRNGRFSEKLVKKLKALPNVRIAKPKADDTDNADFFFRYVATVE
ncbi:MAG: hypothetical protein QM831_14975 [Kofleriaceae bacterium]